MKKEFTFNLGLLDMVIIEAYRAGYRVVGDSVISPVNNRPLKLRLHSGYPMVFLTCNNKICPNNRQYVSVHRFAAYQYFGMEVFQQGMCVQHIDNDKTNFSKENLKVGTYSENEKHKYKSGKPKTWIRKCPLETNLIIENLRAASETKESQTQIANRLNISLKQVNYVYNNYYLKLYNPIKNDKRIKNLDDLLK